MLRYIARAAFYPKNVMFDLKAPTQLCIQKLSVTHPSNQVEEVEDSKINPKDRTKIIPVETSILYMKSDAYKSTYGTDPVWKNYRRNHKGAFPPLKTRKTCIRKGVISTGNPCPICRDEYLILEHTNVDLLKQFISPYNGEILSYSKTGLCQKKHLQLLIAITRAKDYGLITFDVPFRVYDYSQYYPENLQK